ncbi:MAG: lamin tail domain-containing protein [Leptospiraceae bacterium]|nr:lamin tail domain-containing protein [Leptospiraceae bacterium]
MKRALPILVVFLSATLLQCSNAGSSEPLNQGYMIQSPEGDLQVFLNNKGFKSDPRFSATTVFTAYVYDQTEYQVECGTDQLCEDKLIFRNETIDSMGFSNDPGFFGYESTDGRYSPRLNSDDPFGSYPQSRPDIPAGFQDPDVFQCFYSFFRNGYECGVNPHPIRKLDTSLSQFFINVYAADGRGFPSFYIQDYNEFQSLNHPISDGDRYFVYIAAHFDAIIDAPRAEDRFKATSSIWSRPIKPDLISPRIPLTVKLLPESPQDEAGGTYELPDFSKWRSPRCQADTVTAGDVFISEILWMGSVSRNGVDVNNDELLEIYNNSGRTLQVGGWKIVNAGPTQNSVVQSFEIPDCTTIAASSTLTIGRSTDSAFKILDIASTSLTLRNSGANLNLAIQDANGTTVSQLTGCTTAWASIGENTGGVRRRSMALAAIPGTPASYACSTFATSTSSNSNINSSFSYGLNTDTTPINVGTAATPGTVPW